MAVQKLTKELRRRRKIKPWRFQSAAVVRPTTGPSDTGPSDSEPVEKNTEQNLPPPRGWYVDTFWDVICALLPFIFILIFITIGIWKTKCS